MGHRPKKELKKPKTAEDKGKRYRCCICRKRAPRKTKVVPYYCDEHAKRKNETDEFFTDSNPNAQSHLAVSSEAACD